MLNALAQKSFELAKDAAVAPVLQEHIKLMATELEFKENKLAEIEKNNIRLEVKNENLEKELAKLKEELAKYDEGTVCRDIGACYIKEDKEGNILQGFYCLTCRTFLKLIIPVDRKLKDNYYCQTCKNNLEPNEVESMLEDHKKRKTLTPTP